MFANQWILPTASRGGSSRNFDCLTRAWHNRAWLEKGMVRKNGKGKK